MMPALRASARPFTYWRWGSVSSVSGSMSTTQGCQKAPTMFLVSPRSTAVLPPMEESTWDSVVVGHWANSMPRMKVAAQNPPKSPTTPPPTATSRSLRVMPKSSMACNTCP